VRRGRALSAAPGQQGAPLHWLSYISVGHVNDVARRAKELGGTVLMDPFDVLDVGRPAMVQDPTGVVVALWEPRGHAGAEIAGEPGSICWNQLATTAVARAGAFYRSLLGWSAGTRPMRATGYTMIAFEGAPRGGVLAIAPEWGLVPPNRLVYFGVSDCGGQTALAQSLGGSVRVPPTDVPGVGRFSVLADPQGAVFAVIELLPA
jgi:predicted enzyme related to lactoylglutathione lyase